VSIATSVCDGVANSATQDGARLEVRGAPIASTGQLGFHGRQFPPFAMALLLASDRAGSAPNPGGSAGTLCLGAPLVRIPGTTAAADPRGRWIRPLNLAAPLISAALPVLPGSTWRFQAWYRDATPLPASNFSEAVEIGFRRPRSWHTNRGSPRGLAHSSSMKSVSRPAAPRSPTGTSNQTVAPAIVASEAPLRL